MFSAHFIAGTFLDHLRYSRDMNRQPVPGEPIESFRFQDEDENEYEI